MQKKDFIQRLCIRLVPEPDQVIGAVHRGEQIWSELTELGYGASEPTGERKAENWYAKLQGESKKQFDGFWKAFNHKHGKSRAAMRWYKMGDLSRAEAEKIIAAATAEANRPLAHGAARKMAEGWLTEMRWEDHQQTVTQKHQPSKLKALKQDLASFKQHNINGCNYRVIDIVEKQIAAIESQVTVIA